MAKKATFYYVDKNYHGQRIDIYLSAKTGFSRTRIISLIKEKSVLINDILVTKKMKKVFLDDIVSFVTQEVDLSKDEKQSVFIPILYKNEDFLVIDKPPFVVSESNQKNNCTQTIVDFAKQFWNDKIIKYTSFRFGLVHRLDKETSGLMIIARNEESLSDFQAQFKKRTIEKEYIACIEKGIGKKSGVIKTNIMRDPLCPVVMTSSFFQGKEAETEYKVIRETVLCDVLSCIPKTGRTHQIRVHFSSIGYPLIGDRVYGKRSKHISRHALHAHRLKFTFKSKEYLFESEMPEDIKILYGRNY